MSFPPQQTCDCDRCWKRRIVCKKIGAEWVCFGCQDEDAENMAKKAKQGYLPEMDPPTIKEIDEKAESYVDARDARMKKLTLEMEFHAELLQLMKKHKLTTYDFDGYTVFVVPQGEKVKVKKKKSEGEENGDED